jgi:hypothetical protein
MALIYMLAGIGALVVLVVLGGLGWLMVESQREGDDGDEKRLAERGREAGRVASAEEVADANERIMEAHAETLEKLAEGAGEGLEPPGPPPYAIT